MGTGDLAEATAVSPTEILINGKAPGETTMIVWQSGGGRQFFNIKVRANSAVANDRLEAVRRQLRDDPDLIADVQHAVDDANQAVSRAESIRKFRILDEDFTQEAGQLSVKLGIRRSVLLKDFAADIDALYA